MADEQEKSQKPKDGDAVEDAETVIEDAEGIVGAEGQAPDEQATAVGDDTDGTAEASASAETDIVEELRAELAATQAKADEYLDRLQRTAADFQNSRRRMENQLTEEVERANAALIMRLLPILDDFDLALKNVPEDLRDQDNGQAAWAQGFGQIRKKLLDMLTEQGLTPITSDGAFDPHQHEAISSEPNEDVESGHIIEVVRAGYEYKGRILRPALVRVAM